MKALFSDFDPSPKSAWQQQVRKDLKNEDALIAMDIARESGIIQPAYCDFSEETALPWLTDYHYSNADQSWQGARYWLNIERIECHDAKLLNQISLTALKGGAEGLEVITTSRDWQQIFHKVSFPHCQVALRGNKDICLDMLEFLATKEEFYGYLVIEDLGDHLQHLSTVLKDQRRHFRLLCLAEDHREPDSLLRIAQLLSSCITIINELLDLDVPLKHIVNHLQIEVLMGDDYLWEICRLRSLRALCHQVIAQYGLKQLPAAELPIKASTSSGEEPSLNPDHQMVRNTTQAMAAVLGGCNLLSVLPHQGGFASQNTIDRRIARNVGLILREESYLHKVADPVAGSYYLQSLQEKMMRKIWTYLQQLEVGRGTDQVTTEK